MPRICITVKMNNCDVNFITTGIAEEWNTHRMREGRQPVRCYLTGMPIPDNNEVLLVCHTNADFPNATVDHKTARDMGYDRAAVQLLLNYTEALKYQHWFT